MICKTTKIGPNKNDVVKNTYLELIIFRLFSIFFVVIHNFRQVYLDQFEFPFFTENQVRRDLSKFCWRNFLN